MPPCTILEDFDDVPEAKSPFSTRAVLRPRLAASNATPAPVTPPPTTSTSNVSSARRRSASSRRKGCTDPACHSCRGPDPVHLGDRNRGFSSRQPVLGFVVELEGPRDERL